MIQEGRKRGMTFEDAVLKKYGGIKHVSFKGGHLQGGAGCTIPDIIRETEAGLEAIECKSVELYPDWNFISLCGILRNTMRKRKSNLPPKTKQRIVFEDLGFTDSEKAFMRSKLREYVGEIQVDFMRRDE